MPIWLGIPFQRRYWWANRPMRGEVTLPGWPNGSPRWTVADSAKPRPGRSCSAPVALCRDSCPSRRRLSSFPITGRRAFRCVRPVSRRTARKDAKVTDYAHCPRPVAARGRPVGWPMPTHSYTSGMSFPRTCRYRLISTRNACAISNGSQELVLRGNILELRPVVLEVIELPWVIEYISSRPDGYPWWGHHFCAGNPTIMIEGAVAEHFEVLGGMRRWRVLVRLVEGVHHADAAIVSLRHRNLPALCVGFVETVLCLSSCVRGYDDIISYSIGSVHIASPVLRDRERVVCGAFRRSRNAAENVLSQLPDKLQDGCMGQLQNLDCGYAAPSASRAHI